MKRLDKILDFFFHSAVGVCLLLGVGVFAAMTMTGCIVFDSLSCICDQSCGQGCGDCWAGCDRACYEVVTCGADDNCSCDWVKCAFGHGCTGNCTENYKTTCGGCDRTFFTECDSCNCNDTGNLS